MAKETYKNIESTASVVGGIGLVAYGIKKLEIPWHAVEAGGLKFLAKLGILATQTPALAFIVAGALLYLYGRSRKPQSSGSNGGHH